MTIVSNSESSSQPAYKVLIVEDSEADFELYQKFFQKDEVYTYEIHYAETASEGLNAFLSNTFDFALIDFSLPDIDGLDLIESIQKLEKYPFTPIIMLTGQGNEAIALAAMKKNIQDYFIKRDLTFTKFINSIYKTVTFIETQRVSLEDSQAINVLIVEDNPADLELYKRFLNKDPESLFNVYEVDSAHGALEFLKKKAVDIILTDYELPDKNGIGLIKSLQQLPNSDSICVVMMTGHGSEEIVVKAMQNGASDYLVKQFITPVSLRKTIKDNVHKKRLTCRISEIQFQQDLLSDIGFSIRESLDLDHIMQSSVVKVKEYLKCDRVLIYHVDAEAGGVVIAETVNRPFRKILGFKAKDSFVESEAVQDEYIYDCRRQIVNNIETANLTNCHYELLKNLEVKSIISIPLILPNSPTPFWGLLIAHFCKEPHFWQQNEIACLNEISLQIAIGIQQGLLVKELQQERDRAKAATRAKSAFLANMSHEIRTPMNGILGMAELLSLSNLSKEDQEHVNIIQASGQGLLNLINDILDLSKLESEALTLNITEFVLQDLVEEILPLFKVLIKEKDLAVQLDIADDLPPRYIGDPYRLKQLLINLLGNAIKFTLQGSVTVRICKSNVNQSTNGTKKSQVKPKLKSKVKSKDLPPDEREIELYFAIEDTGIGITVEEQQKLFQPFSQVVNDQTRQFSGTGLGLSICKKLVNLMGGQIGVESELGRGSKFWFTAKFLMVENIYSTELESQQKMTVIESQAVIQGKILLVEDNPTNQKVIRRQLRRIGYECDIAENGDLALKSLQKNAYVLILMDCQMPVLNGYDTTAAIRKNPAIKDMFIVGLTASAMVSDRQKCISVGMNDYLTKPCSLAELKAILEKWIPVSDQLDESI